MTTMTVPPLTRRPAPLPSLPDLPSSATTGLSRFLGWFSIGLGLAEFLAPRAMADLTGVPHPTLLRLYGLREVACGVGILNNPASAGWLWARVAGDALDLAALGEAMVEEDGRGGRALASAVAVAGVAALDVLCASRLSSADGASL